jgi:hypothetical protein
MSKYITVLILIFMSIVCGIGARQLFLLMPLYENSINETACLFISFFILVIATVLCLLWR